MLNKRGSSIVPCGTPIVHRCSVKKVFWKYAANWQESTHIDIHTSTHGITLRHGCSPVNLVHIFIILLLRNFIEITHWYGCSPVNLLHISQHLFLRATLEGYFCSQFYIFYPDDTLSILYDFYMLSQILRDGINVWVIFKETTCISKYQLDLSLLQALQQHLFLRMIPLT